MENLNDMFDLNNLIGRLRRIENDPAAQFEDIEDAFNDMIGQPIVAPIIKLGILSIFAACVALSTKISPPLIIKKSPFNNLISIMLIFNLITFVVDHSSEVSIFIII